MKQNQKTGYIITVGGGKMNIVPRNNSLFDFLDEPLSLWKEPNIMKADISIKDGNYKMEVDLPGFKKEDVKIDYDNGYLTISATKETREEEYIRQERYYGKYQRSFYIGDVEENDIKAIYDNGTVLITFPVDEKKKDHRRVIDIE